MTRTLRKTTLPIVVAIMLLAGCSSDEQSSGDPVTIESQSNDEAGATTNYMACLDKNDDTDTWCKKHKSGTSANTNWVEVDNDPNTNGMGCGNRNGVYISMRQQVLSKRLLEIPISSKAYRLTAIMESACKRRWSAYKYPASGGLSLLNSSQSIYNRLWVDNWYVDPLVPWPHSFVDGIKKFCPDMLGVQIWTSNQWG